MNRVAIGLVVGASLLLAAPAQAQTPSLSTVLAHTHAANTALQRAVANFNAHALGAGRVAFKSNRNQMGIAVSQTARLIRDADTPAARLAAAKALVAVARQSGTDERALARVDRVLPKDTRLQRRVIRAAAVDTVRATNAIDRLNALLPTLPATGQAGVTNAVARLTLSHQRTVAQLAADVTSHRVGAAAKAIAAADLAADIRGQRHAINLLQAIAPLLPAAAQEGIAHALASIAASLDAQAARLDKARAHAPAALRPDIRVAIRKAHRGAADARS